MKTDPYAWPVLYEAEHDHDEDQAWYRAQAFQQGGPVLELGCGSGRLSLPLLEDGHTVYGIDLSRPMLERLDEKLAQLPQAAQDRFFVHEGSFLDIPEDWPRFPLVLLPYNALHHCHEHRELLRLFDGVRRHLAPGGLFALDCYLPDFSFMVRDPTRRYEVRRCEHPLHPGEEMVSWEHSWYEAQTQIHHVVFVYQRAHGEKLETHLPLRMYYPRELAALIDWAGFEVVHESSDFGIAPVTDKSLKLVLLLRVREGSVPALA